MDKLEQFLNNNYQRLIQTYLSERKRHNNIGALFINLDLNEDNVYYLPIEQIKEEIRENIISRNKLNTDKALLLFYDKNNSQLTELILSNNQ